MTHFAEEKEIINLETYAWPNIASPPEKNAVDVHISVIIPVHNAAAWLDECLASILAQTGLEGNNDIDNASGAIIDGGKHAHKLCHQNRKVLEVSVYDDASIDGSGDILSRWCTRFRQHGWRFVHTTSPTGRSAKGAGYARNVGVRQSHGKYLCFLDADDVMMPTRMCDQLACLLEDGEELSKRTIVGSGYRRIPEGSTWHYTAWCNNLTKEQLYLQQYRELTVIQPTWFCHRAVFDNAGGYDENPDRTTIIPEDLLFFHRHLDRGGRLKRVEKELILYRHVGDGSNISSKIHRKVLLRARLRAFERRVLSTAPWRTFVVWGAGRDGKSFVSELCPEFRGAVRAMCDVDKRKIDRKWYVNGFVEPPVKVPVVHFRDVTSGPVVCCVSMGRTGGELEQNVAWLVKRLGLVEGVSFFHFS